MAGAHLNLVSSGTLVSRSKKSATRAIKTLLISSMMSQEFKVRSGPDIALPSKVAPIMANHVVSWTLRPLRITVRLK